MEDCTKNGCDVLVFAKTNDGSISNIRSRRMTTAV